MESWLKGLKGGGRLIDCVIAYAVCHKEDIQAEGKV